MTFSLMIEGGHDALLLFQRVRITNLRAVQSIEIIAL